MKTQQEIEEMKDMITVYQEINKRRQSREMDVNSLTMFAEAWGYQKRIIDEQQKKVDKVLAIMGCNLGKDDFENMRCPDYQTMLNTLIEIKELLK